MLVSLFSLVHSPFPLFLALPLVLFLDLDIELLEMLRTRGKSEHMPLYCHHHFCFQFNVNGVRIIDWYRMCTVRVLYHQVVRPSTTSLRNGLS